MRRYRPLRGVRVLSFEAAFSLPAATRVLAELGADVVRIGRPSGDFPPFVHRTDGSAINKRSVSIDLRNPSGRALALRLAAAADVVCSNFRPRFLERAGLHAEALRAARPDVIVLQLSGYGTPGPWRDVGAFGPSVEAAGGMDATIGEPSDPPTKVGSTVFADQAAGRYAALAVIAALERRRAHGVGSVIDLSMYEAIVHLLGDLVLQAARTGEAPAKRGNRSARCAPQGVYPCRGEDEWVAISVRTDAQWHALLDVLAADRISGAAALDRRSTASARDRALLHDEIDAVIASWTRSRAKDAVADRLQRAGVAAAPVQRPSDVWFDPQLRHRGAFQPVRHEATVLGYGAHPHLTLAWQTRGFRRAPLRDARPDGGDNHAVLGAWLGLSKRDVDVLQRDGALLPANLPPVDPPPPRPRIPVDADFATRLGLDAAWRTGA